MKTYNKDIDIFNTLEKAQKAFDKTTDPCQLLYADGRGWFVDKSKQAIIDWPKLYTLINEK